MLFDTETGKTGRNEELGSLGRDPKTQRPDEPSSSFHSKIGEYALVMQTALPQQPRQLTPTRHLSSFYPETVVMETQALPPPQPPLTAATFARKEPAAGGSSSCVMDHAAAYQSLIPIYIALREERDDLLNLFGNFDNITETQEPPITDTFKTVFRIGRQSDGLDDLHSSATEADAEHDDPGLSEFLSQGEGAGGGTVDTEDEDLDPPIEPRTVQEIRAANSAMIDRILDGPEEKFNFEGIGQISSQLSMLQDVLGTIVNPTEKQDNEKKQIFYPVLIWDETEKKYKVDPELIQAASNQEYAVVTEIPIVLVCCVYAFNGNRPAHLFAIIFFKGKLYVFGFGYKDSDWEKDLETIPLAMYNPDDIMGNPCFTGSEYVRDFRNVGVLDIFKLEPQYLNNIEEFVVNKFPPRRTKMHKYVPVLKDEGGDKCIYVASTSPENDLLLYDLVNPELAYNCAKALAKKIFPDRMYCWGNSLATTIRMQALSADVIVRLSSKETKYYKTLLEWKKIKDEIATSRTRNKIHAALSSETALKEKMISIKTEVKGLMQPHQFDWGVKGLKEFQRLYAAQGGSPKEIADAVLNFLTTIQSPAGPAAAAAAAAASSMSVGGKRKTHKKRTRSKRNKPKRPKSKRNQSKKRTKKHKNTI